MNRLLTFGCSLTKDNYQVKDHHPVTEAHCEFAKLMASKKN